MLLPMCKVRAAVRRSCRPVRLNESDWATEIERELTERRPGLRRSPHVCGPCRCQCAPVDTHKFCHYITRACEWWSHRSAVMCVCVCVCVCTKVSFTR